MTDEQVIEIRKEIEKALHIDWAFKKAKPTRIVVDGSPTKGAYHTSYDLFVSNIVKLFEKRERQFAEQSDKLRRETAKYAARTIGYRLDNMAEFHQNKIAWEVIDSYREQCDNSRLDKYTFAELQKELELPMTVDVTFGKVVQGKSNKIDENDILLS